MARVALKIEITGSPWTIFKSSSDLKVSGEVCWHLTASARMEARSGILELGADAVRFNSSPASILTSWPPLAGGFMSLSRASLTAFSSGLRSFTGVVQAPAAGRAFSAMSSMITDDSGRGDFSSLYATWFGGVVEWTSALGVRSSDKYDIAQNVFVIVHRRLPDCDRRNIAGWLYRITARQVRDYRRQRWNQSYFKSHEEVSHELPSRDPTPAMSLETREAHRILSSLLSGLHAPTRSTFVLFEFYGFTCEEIAALHKVSPNTIWARLKRARKTVVHQLAEWSHASAAE